MVMLKGASMPQGFFQSELSERSALQLWHVGIFVRLLIHLLAKKGASWCVATKHVNKILLSRPTTWDARFRLPTSSACAIQHHRCSFTSKRPEWYTKLQCAACFSMMHYLVGHFEKQNRPSQLETACCAKKERPHLLTPWVQTSPLLWGYLWLTQRDEIEGRDHSRCPCSLFLLSSQQFSNHTVKGKTPFYRDAGLVPRLISPLKQELVQLGVNCLQFGLGFACVIHSKTCLAQTTWN